MLSIIAIIMIVIGAMGIFSGDLSGCLPLLIGFILFKISRAMKIGPAKAREISRLKREIRKEKKQVELYSMKNALSYTAARAEEPQPRDP